MVFVKEFFEKVDFENDKKSMKKIQGGKELNLAQLFIYVTTLCEQGETVRVPMIVGAFPARIYAYLNEVFYIMLKRNINAVNDFS